MEVKIGQAIRQVMSGLRREAPRKEGQPQPQAPQPPEITPPVGIQERGIVNQINQGNDPDETLQSIAGQPGGEREEIGSQQEPAVEAPLGTTVQAEDKVDSGEDQAEQHRRETAGQMYDEVMSIVTSWPEYQLVAQLQDEYFAYPLAGRGFKPDAVSFPKGGKKINFLKFQPSPTRPDEKRIQVTIEDNLPMRAKGKWERLDLRVADDKWSTSLIAHQNELVFRDSTWNPKYPTKGPIFNTEEAERLSKEMIDRLKKLTPTPEQEAAERARPLAKADQVFADLLTKVPSWEDVRVSTKTREDYELQNHEREVREWQLTQARFALRGGETNKDPEDFYGVSNPTRKPIAPSLKGSEAFILDAMRAFGVAEGNLSIEEILQKGGEDYTEHHRYGIRPKDIGRRSVDYDRVFEVKGKRFNFPTEMEGVSVTLSIAEKEGKPLPFELQFNGKIFQDKKPNNLPIIKHSSIRTIPLPTR